VILLASPDDDRDYPYVVKDYPPAYDLRKDAGEVEHQHHLGSCTANSVVSACEIYLSRNDQSADLSRLFNYYLSREMSGMLAMQGAYLRDAVKAARKQGLPLERTWPYDLSKEAVRPPDEAYEEALKATLTKFERVPQDNLLNGIRSAVSEGYPVVIGMPLGPQFMGLTGPLAQQNYQVTQPYVGNHAMCVVGYTPDYLILENSWGAGWGDGGYGALPNAAIPEIFEAWVINYFAPDWKVPAKEKLRVWWDKHGEKLTFPAMALAFGALILLGTFVG